MGHSRLFGCLAKLGAKWAELVQKFVARSRVGIFHKEHTRSNPLDPKLTFWWVLYYLGEFATVWLPYGTRCKTTEQVQMFVPRSRVVIFRNECNRSTPLDRKLMFRCVSYNFGALGSVWLSYKTRCHEVASEFFATKAPDPPHWTLKKCFGAFHKILVRLGPFC